MIDIKHIRENPNRIKEVLIARQQPNDTAKVDIILELDKKRRVLIAESDKLKAERNSASDEIAKIKKAKGDAAELIAKMKVVSDQITALDTELRDIEFQQEEELLFFPNILHESVPLGKDSSENKVYREHGGGLKDLTFTPKDHLSLGKYLGILDFERGAKISGAGFPVYLGKGATLERALINFMLNTHIEKNGYKEVFPPFFVNLQSMRGTGQFPKFIGQSYHVGYEESGTYEESGFNLFAVPTAEVPITNLHRDEVLKGSELPIRYAGYSACFRSEAGSYGKDVKGFLRVHQFNKVELVKFVKPETSYDELEGLLRNAESVVESLKLRYRTLLLCSGDIGSNAAKCYDIEVWSPAEKRFLEASSCSNFEDFQARRANIRFKRDEKSKPEFVHTLNGSGLATSRLMVAILENYQTEEGNVIVPEVLRPFTGFDLITP